MAENDAVPGWRIEDLDREDAGRRHRVSDPIELLAIALAALVTVAFFAGAFRAREAAPTAGGPASSSPPATPRTLAATLALDARALQAGVCGQLTASVPASSFESAPRQLRRIDASVSLQFDPWWVWCVSGVRFYDNALEVVGRFLPIRDATGGPSPRVALRSAELEVHLDGFGALGPAAMDEAGVLRLGPAADARSAAFQAAAERVTSLTLRLTSMDGSWAVTRAAASGDPTVMASQRDRNGVLTRVYLVSVAQPNISLTLRR